MTDRERSCVADLLAAHGVLIHWCETLITAHADLVELASEADLLNMVEADEHEQRLTDTRGVIEAQRRHAARLRATPRKLSAASPAAPGVVGTPSVEARRIGEREPLTRLQAPRKIPGTVTMMSETLAPGGPIG